jgi:hypothetical protein
MTKARTADQFQSHLDNLIAWRIKELATLKLEIKTAEAILQKCVIRATVCLAYAHWEGFIKESSDDYVEFVGNQKLCYNQLASCFVVLGAKVHLNSLRESQRAESNTTAVDFFRNKMGERARITKIPWNSTQANLSSKVFENIAQTIGIDPAPFSTRYHQIDNELLKLRNQIAHGEFLKVSDEDCIELVDSVIGLMTQFKSAIENAVSIGSYLAATGERTSSSV